MENRQPPYVLSIFPISAKRGTRRTESSPRILDSISFEITVRSWMLTRLTSRTVSGLKVVFNEGDYGEQSPFYLVKQEGKAGRPHDHCKL